MILAWVLIGVGFGLVLIATVGFLRDVVKDLWDFADNTKRGLYILLVSGMVLLIVGAIIKALIERG